MNIIAISLIALSLATFCSLPADAQQRQGYRRGLTHRAWSSRKARSEYQVTPSWSAWKSERSPRHRSMSGGPPRPRWRRGRDPTDGRAGPGGSTSSSWGAAQSAPTASERTSAWKDLSAVIRGWRYLSITLGSLLLAFTLLPTASRPRDQRRRQPLGRTYRAGCRISYRTGPARCGRGRHSAARRPGCVNLPVPGERWRMPSPCSGDG